jgi:hypothetical protein
MKEEWEGWLEYPQLPCEISLTFLEEKCGVIDERVHVKLIDGTSQSAFRRSSMRVEFGTWVLEEFDGSRILHLSIRILCENSWHFRTRSNVVEKSSVLQWPLIFSAKLMASWVSNHQKRPPSKSKSCDAFARSIDGDLWSRWHPKMLPYRHQWIYLSTQVVERWQAHHGDGCLWHRPNI